MGAIRATAVAGLILIGAGVAAAECVTGVRLLSTSASVPNLVAGPIAWSGNVLAVVKTEEGVPGAVSVAIYGDGMETIEPDRFVASDARSFYALIWTGTEFGLFYRNTSQGLNLQRLTMLGTPVGAPIAITPGRPVFAGDRVQVRWSPVHDAYVVVRFVSQSNARGLYITMIEKNGSQRSDRPVFVEVAQSSPVALGVTGAGVIGVVFVTTNDQIALAIARGSTDSPVVRQLLSGAPEQIVVAARNEQFIVVRTALSSGKSVIRWLIADPSHQIVRPDALLVAIPGDDVHPQELVITDDELALSYVHSPIPIETLDDTFRLRRFTFTGALIGDTMFAATDLSAARAVTPYPFVWTGTSYIAAPVRASSDRLNSYLVRYCPLRVEILGPRVVLAGDTVTFAPSPDGGVPGYTYEWRFSHESRVERGTVTPVQRTFTETGTYTATLTVTDSTGVVTTTTFTFEVVKLRRRGVRN